MAQSNLFQINNEIPWQDLGAGIQRQIFGFDDKLMIVKVKFEQGAIGTLHQHHHTQASYIESGSFEVTIGNEIKILNTGDGFYIPPNAMHGVVCLQAGVLIDSFSPVREDFLPQ
jgi:quercetin dioxygenase-like cupin family protein